MLQEDEVRLREPICFFLPNAHQRTFESKNGVLESCTLVRQPFVNNATMVFPCRTCLTNNVTRYVIHEGRCSCQDSSPTDLIRVHRVVQDVTEEDMEDELALLRYVALILRCRPYTC